MLYIEKTAHLFIRVHDCTISLNFGKLSTCLVCTKFGAQSFVTVEKLSKCMKVSNISATNSIFVSNFKYIWFSFLTFQQGLQSLISLVCYNGFVNKNNYVKIYSIQIKLPGLKKKFLTDSVAQGTNCDINYFISTRFILQL